MASHSCNQAHRHAELGTAVSWDDGLHASARQFEHKFYNLFTCSCYSFVAGCLNRLSYGGSLRWNMVNVAALVLWRGRWVNGAAMVRSFFPFFAVLCLGALVAGWPFLLGLALFSSLLLAWFLIAAYCVKNLVE